MITCMEKRERDMSTSSNPNNIVFVDGCRIPFQKPATGYRHFKVQDLARFAIRGLLDRTRIHPDEVDHVIFGSVTPTFSDDNPARTAALGAGLPATVQAHTVTMSCLSSNQAITSGIEKIMTGQAEVVIAGGADISSGAIQRFLRYEQKSKETTGPTGKSRGWMSQIRSFRPSDLLPNTETGHPPAVAPGISVASDTERADRIASLFGVSREIQDAYTVRSRQSAIKAENSPELNDERIPVAGPPDFTPVTSDNGCYEDSTPEKLAKHKPIHNPHHSTVTKGNSAITTDGASAVLIMTRSKADELGFAPQVELKSYVYTAASVTREQKQDSTEHAVSRDDSVPEARPGQYPGAALAIPKLLDQNRITLSDIDVFEIHEASAAEILGLLSALSDDEFANKQLGKKEAVGSIPMKKLNPSGGTLAIGHPPSATGTRLVTTAAHRLSREKGKLALIASGSADGMGHAMLLEKIIPNQ